MVLRVDNDTGESGQMRRGLTAVIILLFIAIILLLVMDVRRQLQHLSFATSDNVQWFLGQSETEALQLELAIQSAMAASEPDFEDVKLRFDVLYSRVVTLRTSTTFRPLQARPAIGAALDDLNTFLTIWAEIIDRDDGSLERSLPQFSQDAHLARTMVRDIALVGLGIFSENRDAQRINISQALSRIAILTVALVTVLIIVVLAMFRLAQIREQDAQTNLEISERLETIISTALDAVVVTDRNGNIIEYNGAAEDMFGFPRSEALGQNLINLIIPDSEREMHHKALELYHSKGPANLPLETPRSSSGVGIIQLETRNKDGEVFPVDVTLARTQSRDGEILVSFIRDISVRVQAEAAMRDARDRAIAGEKQKADLLAVMSHEMRTPLNGMLGTLDLFDTDRMSTEHQHYLDVMRKSGQVLLGHVNDVLDVSRLDAGKMSMRKHHFDLVELLRETVEGQMARASERGNTIEIGPLHPDLHDAYSDPDRLRQVVLNLVGNAIKFTENGKIFVEAICLSGLDEVEIRVTDNGVGISQTDLDRVFGDFVTIDSSYARRNTGTGLGLGISQRLVSALGGEMGAESEPGDGSVFWFRLSLAAPQAMGARALPPTEDFADLPEKIDPMQVLLVEDNPTNRMVARQLLQREGHTVVEAEDGTEGVEKARYGSFDLILMDISMPGMDGVTATSLIRLRDMTTPIIATTAHALPAEADRFIQAGMNSVLVKPLTKRSLQEVLAGVQNGSFPTSGDSLEAPNEETDLFDHEQYAELIAEMPDEQARLLTRKLYTEMQAFLVQSATSGPGETEALAAEAHRLAGSAGVFGAVRLNLLLRDIQTAASASPDTVPALLQQVPDVWAGTKREIQKFSNARTDG